MGIVEETESTTKKLWVISGIQFMTPPLKPIYTKKGLSVEEEEKEEKDCCCRTPTTPESQIPVLKCPPGAPKKRKSVSRNHWNIIGGVVTDYFKPPELETVFIRSCLQNSSS
ncbi:hypothetical protein QVD17_35584 [Tagetes erecta]|uniref:Uncharacterized protein n=1 Tax=Tagetes erecta TaxID=13708 RepID=A0AAD8K3P5_TARER|nr:hypothetical protein QVD17_35584 [Tagetes erecta]